MSDDSVVQGVVTNETSYRSASRSKGAVCFRYERDGERTHVRIARDIEPHYSDIVTTSEPDARAYEDALPENTYYRVRERSGRTVAFGSTETFVPAVENPTR